MKNYTPAEFRISRGNDCRCEIDFDKWHEDRSYAADPMGEVISDYIPHWKRMIARVDRGLNLEMEVDGVLVERMRVESDLVGAVAAMLHKYRG